MLRPYGSLALMEAAGCALSVWLVLMGWRSMLRPYGSLALMGAASCALSVWMAR
jgi:hypothetical protein